MICADFAAECKRQGDMANCYRWRNVMAVERVRVEAFRLAGEFEPKTFVKRVGDGFVRQPDGSYAKAEQLSLLLKGNT